MGQVQMAACYFFILLFSVLLPQDGPADLVLTSLPDADGALLYLMRALRNACAHAPDSQYAIADHDTFLPQVRVPNEATFVVDICTQGAASSGALGTRGKLRGHDCRPANAR